MNKKSLDKLNIFLKGFETRLSENYDFFIGISIVFKSGIRKEKAAFYVNFDKIEFSFLGTKKCVEVSEISSIITQYAERYDSMTAVYQERGVAYYIEADNKNVKYYSKKQEILEEDNNNIHRKAEVKVASKKFYVDIEKARNLLYEIGILDSNGKIKNDMVRKYNQINHFIELVDVKLRELIDKNERINIVDCGCGKSYLSFVLNYYMRDELKSKCFFTGIDISQGVIEKSEQLAKKLGYRNMQFKKMNIRDYRSNEKIDVVISLHACDTATDEALAFAINSNASYIIVVPCCQSEIMSQINYEPFKNLLSYGVLKTKISDAVTDGIRAMILESMGYKVSMVEYVSPLDTPKNVMIRAYKYSKKNDRMFKETCEFMKLLHIEPTLLKLLK